MTDRLTRALTCCLIRLDRPDAEARDLGQDLATLLRLHFPGLQVRGVARERVQLRARAVMALRKDGVTVTEIAKRLGISRQWVYALTRRSLGHASGDKRAAVEN